MTLTYHRLHPLFAAEASPVDLRAVSRRHRREPRRVTTPDLDPPARAATSS